MNPFEMVVILVALGILAMLVRYWVDSRTAAAGKTDGTDLEARLARIEERLENLEAIVTSDRWELERQFHRLDEDPDRS